MIKNTATLESTGFLVIDMSEKTVNAADWQLNTTVETAAVNSLAKMGMKAEPVSFSDEDKKQLLDSLPGEKYFQKTKRNEKLASVISLANSKGMDGMLVIVPASFQYPNSKLILEGYGILYITDNYYPNRPLHSYFYAAAYLIDVKSHGIFKLSLVGGGAKIELKRELTEEEKREIKRDFDLKYADSEEDDLDWKLKDAMKKPHHMMSTFKDISDNDKQQIISELKSVLETNIAKVIPTLFEKKPIAAWEDDF